MARDGGASAGRQLCVHARARLRGFGGFGGDVALLDRLYAVIRMLGALDRSLVLLSLEGASYRDMARLHALSETNVGVRLNRARAWIAAQMEAYGDGL
jgi:RNA polymerase sigma-70 factor (ECF subfamily)